MYLSRLTLNPRQPQARRDLSDPYEMHRTLSRAFVVDAATPPARFLWRLESGAGFQPSTVVLVQSATRADWSVFDPMAAYADEILGNKAIDLDALIRDGARYRFRLLANPTVTRAGKRYGLVREDDQVAWLARQGERNGFRLHGCVRGASERLRVNQKRTPNRITVDTALFDGLLEVESSSLVKTALRNGLGHAKAFGLGLLSVARAG
jgi:CRISPR system Cascade subunit CasE